MMPLKSQAQRKWMWANHPEMARRWEKHTPKGKKLPARVKQAIEKIAKGYRPRVEAYVLRDGKLLSGVYPDGSIGTYGGGIESGETAAQAARREFKEESGLPLIKVKPLPIASFSQPWQLKPHEITATNEEKAQRIQKWKGSKTDFVFGQLGKRKKTNPTEPATALKQMKWRSLDEAIRIQTRAIRNTSKKEHKDRMQHRLKVFEVLKEKTKKQAEELPKSEKGAYYSAGTSQALRHLGLL